jgi:phosphate:Na+ symporter
LTELHEDLTRVPATGGDGQPSTAFVAGGQALAAWLDATKDPEATPAPAVFRSVEEASSRMRAERETGRQKLLEDVALQRMPAADARAGLDALAWADAGLYHAWRLTESLRIASGK